LSGKIAHFVPLKNIMNNCFNSDVYGIHAVTSARV